MTGIFELISEGFYWVSQIVIIILLFKIFSELPEQKELYEQCDWKILCERGKLSSYDRECELYLKQTGKYDGLIHSKYPEIIINNSMENN